MPGETKRDILIFRHYLGMQPIQHEPLPVFPPVMVLEIVHLHFPAPPAPGE